MRSSVVAYALARIFVLPINRRPASTYRQRPLTIRVNSARYQF